MDVFGVDEQCLSFSNDLNYSATKRGDLKPIFLIFCWFCSAGNICSKLNDKEPVKRWEENCLLCVSAVGFGNWKVDGWLLE